MNVSEQAIDVKVAYVPIEDVWFDVDPYAIDRSIFQEPRKDKRQEEIRKLINEAFEQIDRFYKKYDKKFKTLMPKKTWESKTVLELKELACELGDRIADWVEQALEWAQRICNGESWEAICNEADTANWYRLIVWKNRYARVIGGSSNDFLRLPAAYINYSDFRSSFIFNRTVPLIVRYED